MRLGPLPCKGLSFHPGCRFLGAQGLSALNLKGPFCLQAKQGGVGCGRGQCLGAVRGCRCQSFPRGSRRDGEPRPLPALSHLPRIGLGACSTGHLSVHLGPASLRVVGSGRLLGSGPAPGPRGH